MTISKARCSERLPHACILTEDAFMQFYRGESILYGNAGALGCAWRQLSCNLDVLAWPPVPWQESRVTGS